MNLTELERLAREATPGPWSSEDSCSIITTVEQDLDTSFPEICITETSRNSDLGFSQSEVNANFISAANPATILALISALKTAREALEFYANDKNHDFEVTLDKEPYKSTGVILDDSGRKARDALATISSVCEGKKEKV